MWLMCQVLVYSCFCYNQKWALQTLSARCWLFLSGIMYCPLHLALAVWNENNPNVKGLSPSPVLSISFGSRYRKITASFILHKLYDTFVATKRLFHYNSARCFFFLSKFCLILEWTAVINAFTHPKPDTFCALKLVLEEPEWKKNKDSIKKTHISK